jgi:hypothetical protein
MCACLITGYAAQWALFTDDYSGSVWTIQTQHMNRFNGHDRRRIIGQRVYLERTAKRLSQNAISQRIADRHGQHNALSQRRISFIETGRATYLDIVELDLIAQALDLPINTLMSP